MPHKSTNNENVFTQLSGCQELTLQRISFIERVDHFHSVYQTHTKASDQASSQVS